MAVIDRKTTYYLGDVKEIDFCGSKIFEFSGGKFEIPFSTIPALGSHSIESCKNCNESHKDLINIFQKKIDIFPNCCDYHKKLNNFAPFNKKDYENLAVSIANKIMYTYHHILNNIDADNWEKDIIDYIEYTIESYGSFPPEYGEPFQLSKFFHYVLHFIGNIESSAKSELISKKELDSRLDFIKNYLKKLLEKKGLKKTDLNVLLVIYQKWLKIFPFDINTYFGNLKKHFDEHLPIINGRPEVNMYSGIATAKMHTKESLIEELIKLTNDLLVQINGVTLFEKGLITDANKIKLELIINSRKLKLKEGYHNSSKTEEQRYRKILKEWFKDEQKFIDELIPILNIQSIPETDVKAEKLKSNKFKTIFKNNLSFTLFEKLHDNYKGNSNTLANYSFIFFSLKKDDLIVCSGSNFIKFLSEHYDIQIDKLDSRQYGKNSKTKLYDAFKASYT